MGRTEIREVGPADAPAEIHLAAPREAMPYLHPPHTDDDVQAYFACVCEGWDQRFESGFLQR
jgi:hypothetical protein